MSVEYPANDLTQMIERVAAENRMSRAGGVASATPLPTVRSADVGRIVEELPPLTADERAALDLAAVQAGVRDERIGTAGPETEGAYGTLESAIAAGAPIDPPPSQQRAAVGRGAARGFAPMSKLPDFNNVQGIDLMEGAVVIDGMRFPIDADAVREYRKFAIETAREAIMNMLNDALPEAAEDASGGTTEGA